MHPKTFTDYALSEELSADEIYTVELLIELARMSFDPNYWDDSTERLDARAEPGYQPSFDPQHVQRAERELQKLTWVSLQRTHGKNRPVRDITALRYLTGLSGLALRDNEIEEIAPLATCVNLKRLHLTQNPISDISALANCRSLEWLDLCRLPLKGLHALRDLWIETSEKRLDLLPLEGLPALHHVTVRCDRKEPVSLSKLRESLESWDVEFQALALRHTPSAQLEVVDEEVFLYYDTKEKFNTTETDDNEMLLAAEHEWLNQKFRELMSVGFEEEEDYFVPDQWNGARSTTIVLLSEMALELLPGIIDGIQQILSYAKKDWIVYLQADGTIVEFSAWIYPFKVMVTKPQLKLMRKLMKKR